MPLIKETLLGLLNKRAIQTLTMVCIHPTFLFTAVKIIIYIDKNNMQDRNNMLMGPNTIVLFSHYHFGKNATVFKWVTIQSLL